MGDEPEQKPMAIGFRDCDKCGVPTAMNMNDATPDDEKHYCQSCERTLGELATKMGVPIEEVEEALEKLSKAGKNE